MRNSATLKTNLSEFGKIRFNQIWNLIRTYAWVIRNGLIGNKLKFLGIVCIDLIGGLAQGITIAFLALCVDFFQGKKQFGIGFIDRLFANENLSGLFLICLVFFGLLMITAAADYVSAHASRKLARDYHRRCSFRILTLLSSTQVTFPSAFPFQTPELRRMLTRSCLMAGKSLESIARLVRLIIYLGVSASILLTIDAKLTLLLLPCFALLLPFLYRLGSNIQSSAQSYYSNKVMNMQVQMGRSLRYVLSGNAGARGEGLRFREIYSDNRTLGEYFDCFDNLLLADDRARLIVAVFKSFFLMIILMLLGTQAMNGSYTWGAAVAYLAAMHHLIDRLRNIASSSSSFVRFYPLVSRYIQFIHELGIPGDTTGFSRPTEIRIRSNQLLEAGKESVLLEPGMPVFYWHPKALDRLNFHESIAALAAASDQSEPFWRHSAFVSHTDRLPIATLKEFLWPPAKAEEGQTFVWENFLSRLGLTEEMAGLESGVETVLIDTQWDALSEEMRAAIRIFPMLHHESSAVFIDWSLISNCSEKFVSGIHAVFSDRFIFYSLSKKAVPSNDFHDIIVSGAGSIIGIGDAKWFSSASRQLRKLTESKQEMDDEAEELELELDA